MTSNFPHLARAPIAEAILDIRVDFDALPAVSEAQDTFATAVASQFPDSNKIEQFQAQISEGGGVTSSPPAVLGRIHWNTEKTRAVQARMDGFSFNCVRGYADWKSFREEARTLWTFYREMFRPTRVVRSSVRYLNRIAIAPNTHLEELLETRVRIGSSLPQTMDEYFVRLSLPFGENRIAVVTQATEPIGVNNDSRALILDIDVLSQTVFEPASDSVWTEFERLREMKNICFFGSLTPKAWEAYK